MTRYSGFNMLALGILYETVLRWVAPANRVLSYASKVIPARFDPEQGKKARVGTPDSVQVLTTQEDGSCGIYRLSGVVWHAHHVYQPFAPDKDGVADDHKPEAGVVHRLEGVA